MAQSAKTPLGVNPFWEQGATPPIEWKQWFCTLKMAIMARDSIEVDKLLKLKPQPTDLFYPTLPTYEEEFEGKTEDEARNREQRNERRRVDFENECKVNERKGAMADRIPWDEADTKFKSLIYLSLGAEARRNYHQKNPHTHTDRKMHHKRTSTRTQHYLHYSTQYHIRQIQIFHIHATNTRITRNILQ